MTHPLKTAAKILTISATLSMYLMSTSANAALNFGSTDASADAKPVYSGQQFAAFVKSDRDRGAGHRENGRGDDDDGRNDDNDGHGEGNDDGHDGDDGHGGDDGDGEGNDGDGEGNDGDGEGDD